MQESDLLVSLTSKLVLYISSIEMEGQRSSLWHGQREGSVSYATLQMTTIYFHRLLREGCWRNQILGSWGAPRSHQWPLPFFGNTFLAHSRALEYAAALEASLISSAKRTSSQNWSISGVWTAKVASRRLSSGLHVNRPMR